MSTLTYLQSAEVRDSVESLEGEVVSRPALLRTDGAVLTYATDVRISGEGETEEVLRAVPIAVGVRDVVYAEVGAAVTLRRHGGTGRLEIVGFAKRKPGRHVRIAVDLGSGAVGPPVDIGLTVRLLTLGELGDLAFGDGFGTIPLGAYAIFDGDVFVEWRT